MSEAQHLFLRGGAHEILGPAKPTLNAAKDSGSEQHPEAVGKASTHAQEQAY